MSSAAARRASSGVTSAATAASSSSAGTSVRFGRRTEDSDDGYSLTLGDALSRGVFQVATTTPDDGGDERPVHWQRLGSTGTAGTAGSMVEVPLGEGGSLREMLGDSPPGSGSETSRRDPDDTYDLSGEVAPGNLYGSFHSMASSVRSSFLSSDGDRDRDRDEEDSGSTASGGSAGSRGSRDSHFSVEKGTLTTSGQRWCRFATALTAAATLLGCTAYFAAESGLLEGAALRGILGRRRGLLRDDPGRLMRKAAREERRQMARDERLERMLERERETTETIERAARSDQWRAMIREGHDGGGGARGEGRRLGDSRSVEEDWHRHLARREAVDWALEPERQRLLMNDGRALEEWDRHVARREAIDRALEPEGQRLLMMRGG